MNIFILRDGVETGPFSWVDVFIMLRKGEVFPEIPARIEDSEEIKSLEEWGLWRQGDEVGPFTLSAVTSKCTTCGHFKVHHLGRGFFSSFLTCLARCSLRFFAAEPRLSAAG